MSGSDSARCCLHQDPCQLQVIDRSMRSHRAGLHPARRRADCTTTDCASVMQSDLLLHHAWSDCGSAAHWRTHHCRRWIAPRHRWLSRLSSIVHCLCHRLSPKPCARACRSPIRAHAIVGRWTRPAAPLADRCDKAVDRHGNAHDHVDMGLNIAVCSTRTWP